MTIDNICHNVIAKENLCSYIYAVQDFLQYADTTFVWWAIAPQCTVLTIT